MSARAKKAVQSAAALAPRKVITWDKAQRIWRYHHLWQDKQSIVHRLPDHYKQRFWENLLADRTPVHYKPPSERFVRPTEYERKKFGHTFNMTRYNVEFEQQDAPIAPIHVPEADEGLWAGEGVLKGFVVSRPFTKKKVLHRHIVPRFWFPTLKWSTLYSEILDKYLRVRCTERALRLIDENYGLDFYLLKTPEYDLNSKLACKLKRELLLVLAEESFQTDDAEKRSEIAARYEQFKMPADKAEWIGLDLNEACKKQQILELQNTKQEPPSKLELETELIERLKLEKEEKTVDGFASMFWKK